MRSLYFNGFLSPTMYIHPTFIGLTQQIEFLGQGSVTVNVKIENEEVRVSLGVAHGLLLQLYSVINRYFSLGQDSELKTFCDEFAACWPDAQREVAAADAAPKKNGGALKRNGDFRLTSIRTSGPDSCRRASHGPLETGISR
jgi:hypothetical protein